jgi:hypothetical protein
MGIYGSSGRTSNPLGSLGVIAGILSLAGSAILWIHYFQPNTTILGRYSEQIAGGGPLADQIRLLSAFLGVIAVVAGIVGGLGGKGSTSTVAAILLGIAGLSYPILTWLNLMSGRIGSPV